MKTLKKAQAEKIKLMEELSALKNASYTDSKEEKARKRKIAAGLKRLTFLKSMILYLETNPSKEFIEAETARLDNKRNLIEEAFTKDHETDSFKKMRISDQKRVKQAFYKEMGLPKINLHLKTLNYLMA